MNGLEQASSRQVQRHVARMATGFELQASKEDFMMATRRRLAALALLAIAIATAASAEAGATVAAEANGTAAQSYQNSFQCIPQSTADAPTAANETLSVSSSQTRCSDQDKSCQ
jgi:hypothetical protein